MLVSVLLIIYNLSIAFISGLVFNRLLSRCLNTTIPVLHPALIILSGWFFIILQLQVIHVFLPVDLRAHLIIWGLVSGITLFWFKAVVKDAITSLHQVASKRQVFTAIGMLVLTALNICSRKADGDVADYHLQAIRWMEEYAVVPGIGNIRRQLGNNSNWFLLNAFGGLHFLGLRSVYTINACIVIVTALFVTPHLKQVFWLRNFIILLYFIVVATRKYTGAVTNDLAVTSLVIILFSWFCDLMSVEGKKTGELLLIVLLSSMLVTCKLSAIPMLVFAAGIYLVMFRQQMLSMRHLYGTVICLIFLFVPWFYTNVINSGYLLFPALGTDIFQVDWVMRPEIVSFEVYANLAYARAPTVSTEIARNFTFSEWWPHWIKTLDIFSIILLTGGLFFLLIMSSQLVTNRRFRERFFKQQYWIIGVTCILALVLWFNHGPSPRFVFGYLVFIIAMGVALFNNPFLQQLLHKHKFRIIAILLGGMIVFYTYTNRLYVNIKDFAVLPPAYPVPAGHNIAVDGGFLFVPENLSQQCWDSPVPCTSLPDPDLQYRGPGLQSGFRIKSQP